MYTGSKTIAHAWPINRSVACRQMLSPTAIKGNVDKNYPEVHGAWLIQLDTELVKCVRSKHPTKTSTTVVSTQKVHRVEI